MNTRTEFAAITAIAMILLLKGAPPVRSQDGAATFRSVLAKASPSIVTVRVVLKGSGQGASESRLELQGVLVDKTGLVMMPNTAFSSRHLRAVMGGPPAADTPENETIADARVIFGSEDKEYPAFLAATDTAMDLAFLQIEDLAGREVTPLDFAAPGASPDIGASVVTVSRLRKGYDYAPYFETLRVGGEISKPRHAWLVDGTFPSFGMPVYTPVGDLIGILTTVEQGSTDESPDTIRFAAFLHSWGGASAPLPTFLLPASAIQGVIAQAQKRAAQLSAERAKAPAGGTAAPGGRIPGDHTPGGRIPGDHTPAGHTPGDHTPGAGAPGSPGH